MPGDSPRFRAAMRCFDEINSEDPRTVDVDGEPAPRELVYAQRMSRWLDRLAPDASEALRLAARCQHIKRWAVPRSQYPMDRKGYKAWRNELARRHAQIAARILEEEGYDRDMIARVEALLLKRKLKVDPEVQCLEDVVCLVFLDHYFDDFAEQHDDDKLVAILRKTWLKMSDAGRSAASQLDLSERARRLVARATEATTAPSRSRRRPSPA